MVKPLRYIDATSDIETGEVMVFLGDRFVVTVRRGEAGPLAAVRQLIEHDETRLTLGPVAVLHGVMDAVVDNYDLIDREIQEDMERLEARRLRRRPQQRRPGDLRPQARGAGVPPGRPAADRAGPAAVRGRRSRTCPTSPGRSSGTSADHLLRSVDHIESYDRLLTDILNAHLAQVVGPAERRHAQDLGLGGDRRGPDGDRRHLRDELPPLPRAGLAVRLPVHAAA